jgi:hypothetical protein
MERGRKNAMRKEKLYKERKWDEEGGNVIQREKIGYGGKK